MTTVLLERSVLGKMLASDETADRVLEQLECKHFRVEGNRKIFTAIHNIRAAGDPVDPITVEEELSRLDPKTHADLIHMHKDALAWRHEHGLPRPFREWANLSREVLSLRALALMGDDLQGDVQTLRHSIERREREITELTKHLKAAEALLKIQEGPDTARE